MHDLLLSKPCECFEGRKHCSCLRPTAADHLDKIREVDANRTAEQYDSQSNRLDNRSPYKARSKYWLFSRYSTGWICGLHADWTQLNFCADDALNRIEKVKLKRRYFFITLLREPVARFLSEWTHVRRGATWRASRYACSTEFTQDNNENSNELLNAKSNDRPTKGTMNQPDNQQSTNRKCYSGDDWKGVDLDDYMNCDTNLAINRQTRMLSDLSKVGCLNNGNRTEYNRLMLESAKHNLNRLAYFGILEYQKISQFVFETTFDFNFQHSFVQLNKTHSTQVKVDEESLQLIKKLNHLDVELYEYAKRLLFRRFEESKQHKSFEQFERSKLSSLDNLKENSNKFPELKLLQKFSKLEKSSINDSIVSHAK